MVYKAKKLYMGHVSVRDYIVQKCIDKNESLIIEYNGQRMTLTSEQLKQVFQFHQITFRSKFSEKNYQLVDFRFRPDELVNV